MRKAKYIVSAALIVAGSFLAFHGAIRANQTMVNAGIGGVFIGIVVLSFNTEYVKLKTFRAFSDPFIKTLRKLVTSLNLESNAVYIPPYENMPRGCVFIPARKDFSLDLAKLDESVVFLLDSEKEMGLVLDPVGFDLMADFESYSEMDFAGIGSAFAESASSVLKSLGLARSVTVYEEGDNIRIYVLRPNVEICSKECEKVACPICCSILLSAAKAYGELLMVEEFKVGENIEILAKKIGGISKWM